jgi:hypothetical protein
MSGTIHALPQYAFMEWCWIKKRAQGQLYLYYIINYVGVIWRLLKVSSATSQMTVLSNMISANSYSILGSSNYLCHLVERILCVWDFSFTRRWRFKWWSLWLWHCVHHNTKHERTEFPNGVRIAGVGLDASMFLYWWRHNVSCDRSVGIAISLRAGRSGF